MNESSEMFKDYTEILLSLLHQLIAAMNMLIIHVHIPVIRTLIFINNTCKNICIISCVIKIYCIGLFQNYNLKRNQQYAEYLKNSQYQIEY